MCDGQPERLEDLELLGHHYSLSINKLKGLVYLITAADRARNLYANEDAARYYRRALETPSKGDRPGGHALRLTAQEGLADVLGLVGRRQESLGHYQEALRGYEEDGDKPSLARLQRKIGSLQWEAGDREAALSQYQSALALLNGQPQHIEVAHLYQEMGRLAFRSGDNQGAIQWAQKALDMAEHLAARNGNSREAASAIAQAYNTLGVALARAARLEEAVEYVQRSIGVAQEYELPQAACRAYTNLGVLYTNLDPGQAIDVCTAGLELAKKIGDLSLQSWLYANLAGAYCTFTGQCEVEGITAAEAAINLDRQLGQLDHLAVALVVLAQIHQCHGDPEAALVCFQEALRLAQEMREPQLLFPCYEGLATVYLEAGDIARTEEFMAKGQQVCEEAGLDVESLVMMPFLY
jgi:adenylate cyclase